MMNAVYKGRAYRVGDEIEDGTGVKLEDVGTGEQLEVPYSEEDLELDPIDRDYFACPNVPKTPSGFLPTLEDPENVGAAEYAALHELLTDVYDGDLEHLDAVLNEVIQTAEVIRAKLGVYRIEMKNQNKKKARKA